LATLVWPISMPSLRSSPWILGAPHNGLSMLISRISRRISNSTVGRPQRFRDFQRQYGINTLCIHNGLLPPNYEKSFAGMWEYATAWDIGKAAKDWPQMNFVIYHSARVETDADIAWRKDLLRKIGYKL
jgi:hypothetical protein